MTATRVIVNGEEKIIDTAPRLNVFVHNNDIRVDLPDAVEINSRNTIKCMEEMSQRAWVHISTGELFQHLFKMLFHPDETNVPIPTEISELNKKDFGVIHGAGMIVLGCEAMFEGKKQIFFRNPEDNLHPKAERRVISMLLEMRNLLGKNDEVQIEELKDGPNENKD